VIVRPALPSDAAAMTALQNRIIRIGGTTAHQVEHSVEEVRDAYVSGPEVVCCHVAVDGALTGFQAVERYPGLPDGWGDIGTFVDPDVQVKGIGAALFAATVAACRTAGLVAINATIRADNVPGLAYYARIGFVDYAADPGWALDDGRVVGRVSRRFDL
jgi:GNAT superfamily N-acetyltransferase